VESQIYEHKEIVRRIHPFKNPKENETRFVAGARRILTHDWDRHVVDLEDSQDDIRLLPAFTGESCTRLRVVGTVSEGGDTGLPNFSSFFALTSTFSNRQLIDLPDPANYPSQPEPAIISKPQESQRVRYTHLNVAEIKELLRARKLPVSGVKALLIQRLLDYTAAS
jgi:hypothetical protein